MGDTVESNWKGLTTKNWERHPYYRITLTLTMYYTVQGGVPTHEDIAAAINDLDKLYEDCTTVGKLATVGPAEGLTDAEPMDATLEFQPGAPTAAFPV